ncbi:phage gpG-like protein [Rhodobium orientis]|uniref:Phage virion morphogenesis protein n=1 Tax=Rhodobium orientis TaxID=34017 RepID=A0A327JTI5_9HYPH|nr:phage virion morphogenesis protein [Rhodobium orientis]MBB4302350.1 phage gpG-like protein [Rhodobium orientis]MBK5949055.1 hypothetical protein [Rhodobium orientis]RAI26618.1 hypothetical protein CH339_13535 [Rhodobium orientis]
MTGAAVTITETGLSEAVAAIDGIAHLPEHKVLDTIGRLVQEQTRRRITSEKTSPDGAAWKENYARTPILEQSGALADSIDYAVDGSSVMIGSGLVYAAIHQFGGVIKPRYGDALKFWFQVGANVDFVIAKQVTMPARPYLGVSEDNKAEILEAVTDWIGGLVQ